MARTSVTINGVAFADPVPCMQSAFRKASDRDTMKRVPHVCIRDALQVAALQATLWFVRAEKLRDSGCK